MTLILLIAPRQERLVHNIPVFTNSDVNKINSFVKIKQEEYGEIERILVSMGTVRIMEPDDLIPVPLALGKAHTYGGW